MCSPKKILSQILLSLSFRERYRISWWHLPPNPIFVNFLHSSKNNARLFVAKFPTDLARKNLHEKKTYIPNSSLETTPSWLASNMSNTSRCSAALGAGIFDFLLLDDCVGVRAVRPLCLTPALLTIPVVGFLFSKNLKTSNKTKQFISNRLTCEILICCMMMITLHFRI